MLFFSVGADMGKGQETAPVLDSPHLEASKLLEAALQQMDGIISGELKLNFTSRIAYVTKFDYQTNTVLKCNIIRRPILYLKTNLLA